jgi:hypothetical protein
MLWRSKTKKEPFDYFRERDALAKQFDDLIEKAGIEAAVEDCDRFLEPNWFDDRHLPPLFTKARGVEQRNRMDGRFEAYRYRLRKEIFAVPDVNLRMQLISADRKFRDLKIKLFQRKLSDAHRSLRRAKMPDHYASFFAAVGGAVFVLVGWKLGGAKGGAAAAVFALIMTFMSVLPEQEATRARNIEQATEEVEVSERELNDAVEEKVFTQLEQDTGEDEEENIKR